jgi:hypothetical protein
LLAHYGIPNRNPSVPLTKSQKAYLQSIYSTKAHPSKDECKTIANHLNLPLKKIEKWFWDQRSKLAKK